MSRPPGIPDWGARILPLLADPPVTPDFSAGYLDLLGAARPGRRNLARRLMSSRLVPRVYERWWRPALAWLAKGPSGPDMAAELRLASRYLALSRGDVVLDIACGPGNFTRRFAAQVGADGLVVGVDASTTMLRRAVRDTYPHPVSRADGVGYGSVGYVRADAMELPFAPASFDAVCCFAALHLFDDPFRALDRITRVLKPGARVALMASCHRGPVAVRRPVSLVLGGAGVWMFGPDELTGALRDRGFGELRQRISGMVQFVAGTRGEVIR